MSLLVSEPNLPIIDDFSIVAIADLKIDGLSSPASCQSQISISKSSLLSMLLEIANIIMLFLLFYYIFQMR